MFSRFKDLVKSWSWRATKSKNFSTFIPSKSLLEIVDLHVYRFESKILVHLIRGISFNVRRFEVVGLVGESGVGKSIFLRSLLGLEPNVKVKAKRARIDEIDFSDFGKKSILQIRGKRIGYISQDLKNSLNPTRTILRQLLDALPKEEQITKSRRKDYFINHLESFGIEDPLSVLNSYPYLLDTPTIQRVVFALSAVAQPDLIIVDKSSQHLDSTLQNNLFFLIEKLRNQQRISVIFVSTNILEVAKISDYIYVMYAGQIVEKGQKKDICKNPQHPYTWALISWGVDASNLLVSSENSVIEMKNLPMGDPFTPRNDYAMRVDEKFEPILFEVNRGRGHYAASWFLHPYASKPKLTSSLEKKLKLLREIYDK